MLAATDAACAAMAKLLVDAELPEDQAAVVRLFYGDDGLSLTIDHMDPGDKTFNYQESTVLVVDQRLAEALSDQTLDVEETGDGIALLLQSSDFPPK